MKTEKYHNNLVRPVILLILVVASFMLMLSGHWGPITKVPDISPGKGVIYEGSNPPKEMLTNPKYVWGRIKEGDTWVYFISEKQK